MKSIALKISLFLVAVAFLLGLAGCGGTGNTTPPPKLGSMAGSWEFSFTNGKGNVIAVEAVLSQDSSGNLSATGSVTPNGPTGSVFEADLFGTSFSNVTDLSVDYLGDTCNGNADTGVRKITGTINSSNQVTITYDLGGSLTANITGTLTPSSNPPFSGTGSTSGVCGGGGSAPVTGVLASSLTGNYSGTSTSDNTETITLTLTDTSGTLSATGNDSKTGSFTATGTAVGNAFSATITPTPGIGGSIFGYFDPKLGAKGSILLTSFQGGNAVSCPNGVPMDNGSCLIAILAMQ